MAKKGANDRTPAKGQELGLGAASVFSDMRSGQDRREESEPIPENRRKAGDRRKAGARTRSEWWLDRGYVESHHFVQKSSGSREQTTEDEPPEK